MQRNALITPEALAVLRYVRDAVAVGGVHADVAGGNLQVAQQLVWCDLLGEVATRWGTRYIILPAGERVLEQFGTLDKEAVVYRARATKTAVYFEQTDSPVVEVTLIFAGVRDMTVLPEVGSVFQIAFIFERKE